jgi:hypothetical protein
MTVVDLNDVRGEVEILQWVKSRQAELKELEDKAKAAIQAKMGSATQGMLDNEIVVTWSSSKRTTFDQKAFEAAHPDLYALFKVTNPSRRFEVVKK